MDLAPPEDKNKIWHRVDKGDLEMLFLVFEFIACSLSAVRLKPGGHSFGLDTRGRHE